MATNQKRTTILDIAREAGASAATVSRVLNNTDYPVKESLRRRIQKVAERLNYRPNIFSQMLKGGTNKVIGVIVPSITNPFYAQLVSDVEARCIAAGYAPIICSSYNSPLLEQGHLEMLLRQQVAGIILSTINNNGAFVRKLNGIPIPCVLFDQLLDGYKGSSVAFDFRRGGYLATSHLLKSGLKRIAFASPAIDRVSRKLIFNGYQDALRDHGMRLDMNQVYTLSEDTASATARDYQYGQLLAEKILDSPLGPDAIVASNDIIAIGMINLLGERQVKVPADISVIGFDDINLASMITPGLTTIRQATDRTAELATDMLFRHINTPSLPSATAAVEPEIVERGSVRKIHTRVKK